MNEDIKREFSHVKEGQDRIDKHLGEQDRHLSDHFKNFFKHTQDDIAIKNLLDAHLAEHREAKKHQWAIYSGIFITALSALGVLAIELAKHFWLK